MSDEQQKPTEDEALIKFEDFAEGEDPITLASKISQALDIAGAGRKIPSDATFEFPLTEALNLLPKRYLRQAKPGDIAGETVGIILKDLYQQLSRGKVEMPISELAYFIPLHLLYHAALDDKHPVRFPLPSVVRAIGLPALINRTPKAIRQYHITEFEDPFTEGEAEQAPAAPVILDEKPAPSPTPEVPDVKPADTKPAPPPAAAPAPRKAQASDLMFSFPASVLLERLPEGFRKEGDHGNSDVQFQLPDIFDQLRRGKVTVTIGVLAPLMPAGSLTDKAGSEPGTHITLPLAMIVDTVGLDSLSSKTPSTMREYDITRMADPFAEPKELPKLVRKPKNDAAPKEPASAGITRGSAVIEADTSSGIRVLPYVPVDDSESEAGYKELPGNVNINAATEEELCSLPGCSPALAKAILQYRAGHKAFHSIFDLHKVSGLGAAEFRQMTGMELNQKRYHRRKKLAGLLKIMPEQITNLPVVAKAVAARPGFASCIISDWDGMILAHSGIPDKELALAAIMPKMVIQLRHTLSLASPDIADVLSIQIGGLLHTISAGPNVILTTAWADNLIHETGLSFLLKVRKELSWLLSFRAYAGPVTVTK